MNKFELQHVALYAKNWYKISDDIIEDLANCIEADGYNTFNKNDVISILLSKIIPISNLDKVAYVKDILFNVRERNINKYGYWTVGNSSDSYIKSTKIYDEDLAIVYYLLSALRLTNIEDLGELIKPDDKVLPINNIDNVNKILK